MPEVPEGVDPLMFRLLSGHINIKTTPAKKLELRGPDDWQARFRDD